VNHFDFIGEGHEAYLRNQQPHERRFQCDNRII